MPHLFERELKIAELTAQKAALVTKRVLASVDQGIISKADNSPVTLADYASQALVVASIRRNFPGDRILAEEEASAIRSSPEMTEKIWNLVSTTQLNDAESDELVPSPASVEDMLDCIDLTGIAAARADKGRVWFIDPVDGTKDFIQRGPYSVCITLTIDGLEKVMSFASPLMDYQDGTYKMDVGSPPTNGFILAAVRGNGATIRPIGPGALLEAQTIPPIVEPDIKDIEFADNGKPGIHPVRLAIAEKLGAKFGPTKLAGAQARYLALGLGLCHVTIRTPLLSDLDYVYDHAGGTMFFEECGGKVTDLNGRSPDFSLGRTLSGTVGVVASHPGIHSRILKATRDVVLGSFPERAAKIIPLQEEL